MRCWLFSVVLAASSVMAQEADSVAAVEKPLTFADSLSIFQLIDSLLQLDDTGPSQLAVRLGYNSNVLSAGRTLGIENFGLAPAVSYYHRSGIFADVTGYWSNDFSPRYYLTALSVGYMRSITRKFSVIAGYDKYLYHFDDAYIPYPNAVSATPTIDLKPVSASLTYSFFFGEQNVHRVMPGLFVTLQKRDFAGLDRVAIMPSVSALWGDDILTEIEFLAPQTLREARDNYRKYGTIYSVVQKNRNVTGIMNYAFALPVSFLVNNWSMLFTYAYNVPVALPGEPLTLSESSYLSGSITYFFSFPKKGK